MNKLELNTGAMTIREEMESKMSYSWEEISKFLCSIEGNSFQYYKDAAEKAWGDLWAKNKEHIYRLFGNQVRIEREVELALNRQDVNEEVRRMIRELQEEGTVSNLNLQIIAMFFAAVPYEDIIENKLSDTIKIFANKFNKGMKLSKAVGKLIKDDKQRDAFQTKYSMAIQGFKAVGTLVMSIDPIDILTMSYSPNNAWRSCHNIVDGEYRAGAVSYVCDESTFISYVYKRKDTDRHTGKELPNKIWRVIGYYNNDMIALSAHYPSTNKSNRQTLVNLIAEVTGKVDQVSGGMLSCDYDDYANDLFEDYGGMHYNDITEGRISRFYAIDLSGFAKDADGESFEERLRYAHSQNGTPKFIVGVSGVPAFGGGEIEDTGRIDDTYEDEDYYDDDDY